MFYQSPSLEKEQAAAVGEQLSALFSLTPSESKRLIAKAVAALPEVKRALEKGIVVITLAQWQTFHTLPRTS